MDTIGDLTSSEPVLAIAHWPDVFAAAPDRVALTLAGHSHCGQVNLPFFGRLIHASAGSEKWPCGLYEERGRKLYVTGGVGVSILPVRFLQPPEIAVVTLNGQ
jgi:predicted MPP superfamily phosphohydrolase